MLQNLKFRAIDLPSPHPSAIKVQRLLWSCLLPIRFWPEKLDLEQRQVKITTKWLAANKCPLARIRQVRYGRARWNCHSKSQFLLCFKSQEEKISNFCFRFKNAHFLSFCKGTISASNRISTINLNYFVN